MISSTNRVTIRFSTGEKLEQAQSAKYLGVLLNARAAIEEELESRLRKAAVTWKKLKPYWRKSVASKRRKILIYNVMIRSKVIYGLESAELKTSGLEKLNRFQLKGLRQILKMVTTFIDRANTNTKVLEEADKAVNRGRPASKRTPVHLLSERTLRKGSD